MVRALRPRRGGRRARSAVDHSSIWRFRQRVEYSLSEKLLAEVNHKLDARGLIVKCGTLVDATIIAAARPLSRKAWSASAIPTRASG